jgi:hypothetical protein
VHCKKVLFLDIKVQCKDSENFADLQQIKNFFLFFMNNAGLDYHHQNVDILSRKLRQSVCCPSQEFLLFHQYLISFLLSSEDIFLNHYNTQRY